MSAACTLSVDHIQPAYVFLVVSAVSAAAGSAVVDLVGDETVVDMFVSVVESRAGLAVAQLDLAQRDYIAVKLHSSS